MGYVVAWLAVLDAFPKITLKCTADGLSMRSPQSHQVQRRLSSVHSFAAASNANDLNHLVKLKRKTRAKKQIA